MDACGFCARPAQRNKWRYRCLECCTFWCDANCRDRHALSRIDADAAGRLTPPRGRKPNMQSYLYRLLSLMRPHCMSMYLR